MQGVSLCEKGASAGSCDSSVNLISHPSRDLPHGHSAFSPRPQKWSVCICNIYHARIQMVLVTTLMIVLILLLG